MARWTERSRWRPSLLNDLAATDQPARMKLLSQARTKVAGCAVTADAGQYESYGRVRTNLMPASNGRRAHTSPPHGFGAARRRWVSAVGIGGGPLRDRGAAWAMCMSAESAVVDGPLCAGQLAG